MKKWLSINYEPWSTIVSKWTSTRSLRAIDLRNINTSFENVIVEWPRYRNRSHGYELIEIDLLIPRKEQHERTLALVSKKDYRLGYH